MQRTVRVVDVSEAVAHGDGGFDGARLARVWSEARRDRPPCRPDKGRSAAFARRVPVASVGTDNDDDLQREQHGLAPKLRVNITPRSAGTDATRTCAEADRREEGNPQLDDHQERPQCAVPLPVP